MSIQFDAAYQQAASNDTSWSHTVGSGSSRILLVMCGMHSVDNVTAVTFNGVSLTKLGEQSGSYRRAQVWYLLSPPQGTYTVQVTRSGTGYNLSAGSVSFFNVSQTSPFRHYTGANGSSYSPSVVVTSLATDVVVDVVVGWTWVASVGAGQTLNWSDTFSGSSMRAHSSRENGGDPSTTMSWTASGSDSNYAMYAASLIEESAFQGDVVLPLLEVAGGTNGADITLPMLGVSAGMNGAALTLPMLYIFESWVDVPFKDADIDLPLMIVAGEAKVGTVSSAAISLPFLELAGYGVNGTYDLTNTFDEELPLFTIEGTAIVGTVSEGDIDLPKLTLSAQHRTGTISRASFTLPFFDIRATTFTYYEFDQAIPLFTVEGYAHGPLVATFDEALPMFEVTGYLQRAQDGYRIYVLNTRNNVLTEYEHFDFNSFCTFQGKNLGAHSSGIMSLEGDDDNGTGIDASFGTGVTDFRLPNKKKITDAYLNAKGDGGMVLTVITDDGLESGYPVTISGVRMKPCKVPVGKGKKGRSWEFILENVGGGDFELNGIDLNVELLSRKI